MSGKMEGDVENPLIWVERSKSKSRLDVAIVTDVMLFAMLVGNDTLFFL